AYGKQKKARPDIACRKRLVRPRQCHAGRTVQPGTEKNNTDNGDPYQPDLELSMTELKNDVERKQPQNDGGKRLQEKKLIPYSLPFQSMVNAGYLERFAHPPYIRILKVGKQKQSKERSGSHEQPNTLDTLDHN